MQVHIQISWKYSSIGSFYQFFWDVSWSFREYSSANRVYSLLLSWELGYLRTKTKNSRASSSISINKLQILHLFCFYFGLLNFNVDISFQADSWWWYQHRRSKIENAFICKKAINCRCEKVIQLSVHRVKYWCEMRWNCIIF